MNYRIYIPPMISESQAQGCILGHVLMMAIMALLVHREFGVF